MIRIVNSYYTFFFCFFPILFYLLHCIVKQSSRGRFVEYLESCDDEKTYCSPVMRGKKSINERTLGEDFYSFF